ncbi:phosphopantetheine-binding protein [Actinocorallia lasiicapitis]
MGIDTATILDRIATLLTTRFSVPSEEYRDDATFPDLDLDSLALVEFGLVAEKEFGVAIAEDEVSSDDTITDIAALIETKMRGV